MDDTYWEEHESHRDLHALLATKVSNHPKTWAEASRRHDAAKWRQACDSELASLDATSTWDLVPNTEVPPGRRALPVRWAFTIKGDGRYKARLVVLGCLQTKADYDDIFAPVIRLECLRVLLVLACLRGYEVDGMDVKTAFLNAALDVEIYIQQPPGFLKPGAERHVCLLKRSLYGLKQSPKLWYETFVKFMSTLGFSRLRKDRCVFVLQDSNHSIFVGLYVDDIVMIAPTMAHIAKLKGAFHERFQMTDLGPLSGILGWEIERNRSCGSMIIPQSKYTFEMVARFGNNAPHASTPIEPLSKAFQYPISN